MFKNKRLSRAVSANGLYPIYCYSPKFDTALAVTVIQPDQKRVIGIFNFHVPQTNVNRLLITKQNVKLVKYQQNILFSTNAKQLQVNKVHFVLYTIELVCFLMFSMK